MYVRFRLHFANNKEKRFILRENLNNSVKWGCRLSPLQHDFIAAKSLSALFYKLAFIKSKKLCAKLNIFIQIPYGERKNKDISSMEEILNFKVLKLEFTLF